MKITVTHMTFNFLKEQLPPHATIEWITNIFSEFGGVAYVSLPKYRDGVRIKGFAFVEFSDSESATKAVKVGLFFICLQNVKKLTIKQNT